MIALRRLCIAGVLACAFLQEARAHTNDILLARLVFQSGPEVALEVTADLAGLPWLRQAANPAETLGKALRVAMPGDRSWALAELGTPVVTVHSAFPYPAPVPLSHGPEEAAPELLLMVWKWRPAASPLRIEIAKGAAATLLFWTVASEAAEPSPGWQMLSEGERTPEVALPFKPVPLQWNWKARLAAGIAVCGLALQAILILGRLRKHRRA